MATFDETEEGDDDSLEPVEAVGEEGSGEDEEIDAVAEVEDDAQVIGDLMNLVEDNQEISEIVEESQFDGVSDLELEEVPLTNLKKDIDLASDKTDTELDAIAASVHSDLSQDADEFEVVTIAEDEGPSPFDAVLDDDVVASDEILDDENAVQDVRFEDVFDAVLELELEEDASAGFDDLPEIVK